MPCPRWRSVLLLNERLMIPRAGIDRAKRPQRWRFGYRALGRTLVELALLQGLDEIGKPLLDRAREKFLHHGFPAHAPLGQGHRDRGRDGPGHAVDIMRVYQQR